MWGLIALGLWQIQQRWWLRPNFVDEQDNFVLGNMVTEGQKLYHGTFSHHQPASYFLSSLVQKVLKPDNILMLVKYHRIFVYGWSMGWWLLIIMCFGGWVLIPMVILETIKIIYLGNLFLAESLVLLPMIFLGLWLIEEKKSSLGSALFLGMLTAFCGLTLAPIWPALTLIIVTFWLRWKDKRIIAMITGAIMIIGVAALKIDISGYFNDAIYVNQKYYVAIASTLPWYKTIFCSVLTPILYLINQNKALEILILKIIIVMFLITESIYYRKDKAKTVLAFGILLLLNLRNFELDKTHYDGFHLLIWVGWLITVTFWLVNKLKIKWLWLLTIFPIIGSIMTINEQIREKNNLADDFEIYYSRIFNISKAVEVSKSANDKLLSMPDEVLVYWKTETKTAGEYIFFYKWMEKVPIMRQKQLASFSSFPEYLVVKSFENLNVSNYLTKYKNFTYRGKKSEFYIRKDKWENMDGRIKEQVSYYGFDVINE